MEQTTKRKKAKVENEKQLKDFTICRTERNCRVETGSNTNIKSGHVLKEAGSGGLSGLTYSELRGPHLSHGSFLLIAEVTWEISWMSPSVQQLSVIGKDGETFQLSVRTFLVGMVGYFCHHIVEHVAIKDKNADTHCRHTAHTPRGVALGWARPCVCRLGDTPPQTDFHQSAERLKMRRPTAAGKR